MSKFKNYILEYYQTPDRTRTFISQESILDNILNVKTIGQHPERSYEDRDVYIEISLTSKKEKTGVTHGGVGNDIQTWLRGEDAIKLGLQLVESGNESLDKNRKHAYEIIELIASKYETIKGNFVKLVITKKNNTQPSNYCSGYHYYDLLYIGRDDLSTRHIKDVVIYWSPFEEEFNKQLEGYANGLSVDKIGWSFEDVKQEFDTFVKENGF